MDTPHTLDEWFAPCGVSHCSQTSKATNCRAVPSSYLPITRGMLEFTALCFAPLMALAAVGVSVLSMFIAQLEHPRFRQTNFPSLRSGIMAGSPCPIRCWRDGPDGPHEPEKNDAANW